MAKYYAPCEDTWPKEWPREVVDSADYERLVEQFATYREAASASIGADLSEQAIARISQLEKLLHDAKRMAEFGDINEDMEDDGVGWKQWYLDVTEALHGTDNAAQGLCFWELVEGNEYQVGCNKQSWHKDQGLDVFEFCPFCSLRIVVAEVTEASDAGESK